MHLKISILSTNCFMVIYEILFNVDSIQALQCVIFSYVYKLNCTELYLANYNIAGIESAFN